MKRSEINKAILYARKVLADNNFHLPPLAFFSKQEWIKRKEEQRIAIQNGMGWDVTDYGQGRFDEFGLCAFTLRNGNIDKGKSHIPYSEKILVMKPGQRLPLHMHITKVEDIINRGLGTLVVQVYNSIDEYTVDYESDVEIYCDAVKYRVKPGELLEFKPGQSITITPGLYHKFWAKKEDGVLICGEISSVNDDNVDNRHVENITRFVEIEEDEEPIGL
ncbi:MAG TPA: D-lyxose/D-mannose family sugar isomerase, partial [Clostridia bacterium]